MRGNVASAVLLLPFPIGFFYTSLASIARLLPSGTAADTSKGASHKSL